MLLSLLALGFVLGLRHALDADHVAAVTSMVTRSASLRETVRVSGAWGLGHAATVTAFGTALILLGATLPQSVSRGLEAVVGFMLIALGVDVLRRLRHRASAHLHAHARGHVHTHPRAYGLPRALLIGCVHGLAGTAALVLLTLPRAASPAGAALSLVVFCVGTILGMVLFSLLISVPLVMTVRRARWAANGLEVVVGTANVALGAWIAVQSLS